MATTTTIGWQQRHFLGHPVGLYLLFATEMWERVSYYGMRALLVLYAVAATNSANPGLGWSEPQALKLYAWYTGLVYLTPLVGGWLADNYIGQRKAVIIGGIVMSLGQFSLASAPSTFGYAPPFTLDLLGIDFPSTPWTTYIGLLLLIVGNGFFKANISTMVGELYREGDIRRDSAFTIFYMGVNSGALLAPLVCSTLGEDPAYGWRSGFLAAGCGMTLSVIIQLLWAQKFLGDIGRVPSASRSRALSAGKSQTLTKEEADRLKVVFVIFTFVMLFWAAFEQQGGLMNLFAENLTRRQVGNFTVPAGWFQSVNPFFIVFVLGPLLSVLWIRLARRGINPPAPVKMYLGLVFVALGFGAMVLAVLEMQHAPDHRARMSWLVLAFFCHTLGELCISPVGLSLVTKLAPLRLASLMMGVWFLTNFLGNLIAGYLGAFSAHLGEYAWMRELAAHVGVRYEDAGLLGVFGGIGVVLLIFAILLWALSGVAIRWMHGAEAIKH